MQHRMTQPASSAVPTPPTSTRSPLVSMADLDSAAHSDAMRTRRANLADARRRGSVRLLGMTAATIAAAGALVAVPSMAEARVLPVPTVTAQPGPVQVPSGTIRCKGKGDFHATLNVRTTTRDRKGDAHVSVWVQEHQGGRARLAGYAWSTAGTVKVTVCINPARIDGDRGPVYVIVEDDVDGYTRPAQIRFPR